MPQIKLNQNQLITYIAYPYGYLKRYQYLIQYELALEVQAD